MSALEITLAIISVLVCVAVLAIRLYFYLRRQFERDIES